MSEIVFAVTKWLSQAMIVCSGVYGMFSDLYKKNPSTNNRSLTRAGWTNLCTLLVGFLLFGVTEYHDHGERLRQEQEQKAATNRADDENRMLQSNLAYLRRLVLLQESVSEWQVSWTPSPASLANAEAVEIPATDIYFKTCLLNGENRANPTEAQHWIVRCRLARPQGYVSPVYDLPPEDPRWKAFERVLDAYLSPHFSVSLENGTEILTSDHASRPGQILLSRWNVAISGFQTKLGSFDHAHLLIQWDANSPSPDLNARSLPQSLRVRSFDMNLKMDETVMLHWTRKQTGSFVYEDPDTGESQKRPLFTTLSGPHVIKATFAADVFPESPPAVR